MNKPLDNGAIAPTSDFTEDSINLDVSLEVEQAIIGSMLINSNCIQEVLEQITVNHFTTIHNRRIFKAAQYLHSLGSPVDPVTLLDCMTSTLSLDKDEVSLLSAKMFDYMKETPSAANVNAYVKMAKSKLLKREVTQEFASFDRGDTTFSELVSELQNKEDTNNKSELPISFGSDGFDNDVEFLIDSFIPAQSFGVMYGASGSYKSFQAIDWGCCVATGTPWNGNDVKQGLVIYVAGEGAIGAKKRIKAWELQNATRADDFVVVGQPIMINEAEGKAKLSSTIRKIEKMTGKKAGMVIIDTLARCYSGEENSNSEMNLFIQNCDRIKFEHECTVMVVHHTGKDESKGARGASSLRGADDFEYKITKKEELVYELACTKMKDDEEQPPLDFTLSKVDVGKTPKGKVINSLVRRSVGEKAVPKDSPIIELIKAKKDSIQQKDALVIVSIFDRLGGIEINRAKLKDDFLNEESIIKQTREFDTNRRNQKFNRALAYLINSGAAIYDKDDPAEKISLRELN